MRSATGPAATRPQVTGAPAGSLARRMEYVFLGYLLLMTTGALGFLAVIANGGGVVLNPDSMLLRVFWLAAYGGVVVVLFLNRGLIGAMAPRMWPAFLVPAFAAASLLWTGSITDTLTQTVGLTLTTVLGIYIGARFSLKEMLTLVFVLLGAAVALSVVATLARLPFATMPEGARGLFTHKNVLGFVSVITYSVALLFALRGTHRIAALLVAALAVVALAMARSSTALMVAGIVTALLPPLVLFQSSKVAGMITACAMALVALIGLAVISNDPGHYFALLTEALGRDASLSGRDLLWAAAIENIEARPFVGTGYSAFWKLGTDWRVNLVIRQLGDVGHLHNNYLQIGVELGLVGLGLFFFFMAMAVSRTFLAMTRTRDVLACWPFIFVVMIMIYCMSEVLIFRPNLVAHMLLVAMFARATLDLAANSRAIHQQAAYGFSTPLPAAPMAAPMALGARNIP